MSTRSLILSLFFLLYVSSVKCFSQDKPIYLGDSTFENTKGVEEITAKKFFDPSRAALLSAVLPGLGQGYNKKYWKIPIIYGGFAAGVYFAYYYNNRLQHYRNELFTGNSLFSERALEHIIRRERRSRDQTMIYTFMFYGLQIVDAHVDAYLKEFDVNENLSIKWEPYFENQTTGNMVAGISLKF